MNRIIKKIMKKMKVVFRSLAERGLDERILDLDRKKEILKENYTLLDELGRGKDGLTLLLKDKEGKRQVWKILSTYGQHYLPLALAAIESGLPGEFYQDLKIENDFIICPYEKLHQPDTSPEAFPAGLISIARMQKKLLEKGLLYWDLGFLSHCNYMLREKGEIRIIDYGGNAFLFLDQEKDLGVRPRRRNLVYARENFVKVTFLLHILNIGLGQKATIPWASEVQHADESELKEITGWVKDLLKGSAFTGVAEVVLNNDLLKAEGWDKVIQALEEMAKLKVHLQEGADITETDFRGNEVEVRGYQNFVISRNNLEIKESREKLWETETKLKLVRLAFEKLGVEQVESFLDIGCNSGLYSFLARQHFQAAVTGTDYNQDYIDLCTRIVRHLGLDKISFTTGVFSDIEGSYDCVLAMGLIHHLYHRTEKYGDLGAVVGKFSAISRNATIIEFPDENDPKASKWTSIAGRKSVDQYSKNAFLEHCSKYYHQIDEIGQTAPTRTVYLLRKKNN